MSSAGDKTSSTLLPSQGASSSAPEEFSVQAHPVANDEHGSAAPAEAPPVELQASASSKESPAEPGEVAEPGEAQGPPLRTKPLPKVNAVAREVAVRVTGAKAGSVPEERDLFSELTTTVMVFEKGGVIRLTSAVIPGQLLFLSNEESKREVVTQVIRKRTYRPTECYVELEFTEPAPGFWGTEFSAATALLPKDAKLIAAAEMIASAETTEDELDESAPPPSAEEVEALKREVAALRSQLQQFQTPAEQEQPPVAPIPKPPVAFPEAATPIAEAPATTYQYAPAADLTSQAVPVEAQREPLCPTSTKPEPRWVPPAEQKPVAKPAMVFRKSLPPRKRSFQPRGQFTPGFRAGVLRLAVLSSILAALIGTVWSKGWIPGIHQPKKIPVSSAGGVTIPISMVPASPGKAIAKTNPGNSTPAPAKGTAPAANPASEISGYASGNEKGIDSGPHIVVVEKPPAKVRNSPATLEKNLPAALITKSSPAHPLPANAVTVIPTLPLDSGFTPPKLLRSERAVASLDDLHDFEGGNVVVDAIVDTDGNVTSIRVLSGPPSMRWPALRALKNYKYEPARENGQPVAAHVTVRMQFHFVE